MFKTAYGFKICFNIFLPHKFTSYKMSLPFRFPKKNFEFIFNLFYACHMNFPSYSQSKISATFDATAAIPTRRHIKEDSIPIFNAVRISNLTWFNFEIWDGKFYRIYQHGLGYGQNNWEIVVRIQTLAGNFSLPQRVQTGSEAHSASYSKGYLGLFARRQRGRGAKLTIHSI
jgi:hypothetical protein